MSDDERPGGEPETVEIEIPDVTAPTLPVEHVLTNSVNFFQRTLVGMSVKFVPLVTLPDGRSMPAPEAYVIEFSAEAWERFKREVAADGVKSRVEQVRTIPGGLLNGGLH